MSYCEGKQLMVSVIMPVYKVEDYVGMAIEKELIACLASFHDLGCVVYSGAAA